MDLIEIILFALFAYTLGKFVIAWFDSRNHQHDIKREEIVAVLDKMIREVNIETYHGLAYWFDKENDRFLAQGATSQEIITVLKSRFPDNIFLLPDGQVLGAPHWIPREKTDAMITQAMFDKFSTK